MAIISISLNEKILEEIDKIQKEYGFSGRSEVIRAGIRMFIADKKEKEKLVGGITSLLLLIHSQDVENVVTKIKHDFEDITNTQIHSHLQEGKCLEIFILEGDAYRIREFIELFQISGKMDYIKLIVA
jgi:CopG family nickel-responsive transcriptional regulator